MAFDENWSNIWKAPVWEKMLLYEKFETVCYPGCLNK